MTTMSIWDDPEASETADEDSLRREVERWRNLVRPSDLRTERRTALVETEERYWVWR